MVSAKRSMQGPGAASRARQTGARGLEAQLAHKEAIERLREFAAQQSGGPMTDLPGVDDAADDCADGAGLGAASGEATERGHVRIVEALIFAAPQPLSEKSIAEQLPADIDVRSVIERLALDYRGRGIQLVKVANKWAFRTADDLSYLLERYAVEERRLSKAALETLAIIAYHQPVTRAEIEEIRGVQTSRGTLDVLMETNWIRPRGRRRAPGKPVTYGTTDAFLSHFGLDTLGDLPGLAELKGSGLLGSDLPADFAVPNPKDVAALMPDELPLDDDEGRGSQLDLDSAGMDADPADLAISEDEDGAGLPHA